MAAPKFDELPGEEVAAPRFDDIHGEEVSHPVSFEQLQRPIEIPGGKFDPATNKVERGFSTGEAALNGAAQGSSQGFGDELYGFLGAVRGKLRGAPPEEAAPTQEHGPAIVKAGMVGSPDSNFWDTYRDYRDQSRDMSAQSEQQHPTAYRGAKFAGGMATQSGLALATGGASLSPAGMALTGGVESLGGDENDLTSGDFSNYLAAAKNTGTGAAIGGALAVGGKLVSKGGSALYRGTGFEKVLGRKIGRAVGDAASLVNKKAVSGLRTGVSALGGETSAGSRTLEVIAKILEDPGATEAQRVAAKTFLESEEGLALRRGVFDSALERAPGQLGRIGAAKEALNPLKEAVTPEAISDATDEALSGPIRKGVWPAVSHTLRNVVPPAVGSTIGGFLGGPLGVAAGATAGGIVSASIGSPGRVVARALKSPAFRSALWTAVENTLGSAPRVLGRYGPVVAEEALKNGPHAAMAMHNMLLESDPEYAQKAAALVQDSEASP